MKKNNKGFSLVELIVVVLIMAIIATALTLAVTKYVAKSKKASDVNTKGELIAAAQTAVTDFIGNGGTITSNFTINTNAMATAGDSVSTDFGTIFRTAAGSDNVFSKVNSANWFVVTVTVTGDSYTYACTYNGGAAITS